MRRRGGFTLIEVLAVIFLTALVFGVALDFYVDLSNQSQHASELTREIRRATGLLDRLAQDLEQTVLAKKPPEMDPLAHPWVFLAESRRAGNGADRVKFVTRRAADARSADDTPGITMVAYTLEADDVNGDYLLYRWSRPQLPESLDRDFPLAGDPAALLMAEGVADFALRFLGEEGEWVEEWDSSQMLDSSELPLAVEIEVALAPENGNGVGDFAGAEPKRYLRRVLLPVRPLDLATLLDPQAYAAVGGRGEAGEEGECQLRVADCLDFSLFGGVPETDPDANPNLSGLLSLTPEEREAVRSLNSANIGALCWDDFKDAYSSHPAVRSACK